MIIDLICFIFLIGYFILFLTRIKLAIYLFLSIVFFLPPIFRNYGLNIGSGEQYISIFIIIGLFYTIRYFIFVANSRYTLNKVDLVIIAYLFVTLTTTILVSNEPINLSFLAYFYRNVVAVMCVYFMGKSFLMETKDNEVGNSLIKLSKYIYIVGMFMAIYCIVEFIFHYNIYEELSDYLVEISGTKSFEGLAVPIGTYEIADFYRWSGPFIDANQSGMMLSVVISFMMAVRIGKTKKSELLIKMGLLIMGAAVLIGGNRSSYLAIIAILFFATYFNKLSKKGLLIIIIILVSLYSIYSTSCFYTTRIIDEFTAIGRLITWEAAIDKFTENNIFVGIGVGTPTYIIPVEYQSIDEITTHSLYLDKLLFTGVLGFGLYNTIIILITMLTCRLYNGASNYDIKMILLSYLFILISLGIMNIFVMEKTTTMTIFWFISGIIVSLQDRRINNGYI